MGALAFLVVVKAHIAIVDTGAALGIEIDTRGVEPDVFHRRHEMEGARVNLSMCLTGELPFARLVLIEVITVQIVMRHPVPTYCATYTEAFAQVVQIISVDGQARRARTA